MLSHLVFWGGFLVFFNFCSIDGFYFTEFVISFKEEVLRNNEFYNCTVSVQCYNADYTCGVFLDAVIYWCSMSLYFSKI